MPITYFIKMHSEASDKICRRRKGLLYTGLAADNAMGACRRETLGKVLPIHAMKKLVNFTLWPLYLPVEEPV
jgi:hypothetical protein